jgi:hypothetical protein
MVIVKGLTIGALLMMGVILLVASICNSFDGMQALAGCACLVGANKGVV